MNLDLILLICYIVGMTTLPFLSDLFIQDIEKGSEGLFAWYDKYILYPLRERNSKWELPLGGCGHCFSIWLNTIYGSALTITYLIINYPSWWLLWIIPTTCFLNLGLSTMLYKLFKQLK